MPSPGPAINYHSLRAANSGLYLGTTLIVLAACGYTLWQGLSAPEARPTWQLWLIGAAGLAALLWGGSYSLLRYQVDAQGITRHSLSSLLGITRLRGLTGRTSHHHIAWQDLAEASCEQQESLGTARCTLTLRSQANAQGHRTTLTLSSDILPLDEVEQLALELHEAGLLPDYTARQQDEA